MGAALMASLCATRSRTSRGRLAAVISQLRRMRFPVVMVEPRCEANRVVESLRDTTTALAGTPSHGRGSPRPAESWSR